MISYLLVFTILAAICSGGIIGGDKKGTEASYGSNQVSLSREETLVLRGIAMLIIVFSHLADPAVKVTFFFYVSGALGVAICFFVSGYGLGKGYREKDKYLSHFLLLKYLRCLLPYYLLYAIYAIFAGVETGQIKTELLTLQMAGNLLWYLKIQLLLYLFFYVSYRLFQNKKGKLVGLTTLCVLYCLVLFFRHVETFWYKTCLFFPLGVWISDIDSFVIPFLRKRSSRLLAFGVSFFMFMVLYFKGRMGMELLIDSIYMLSFTALGISLCIYITKSALLNLIGKKSLEVYLIHCLILRLWRPAFPGTNAFSYISLPLTTLLLSLPVNWVCSRCMSCIKRKLM